MKILNQKLVLTGGPSGGKTTMAQAIERTFKNRVTVIPESASILFSGGFLRRNYDQAVMIQQQAIYSVQVLHEKIFEMENHCGKLLVCDRGTLDGLAYWPHNDKNSFFTTLGTTLENEINRYKWVIHLDTAGAESYDRQNVVRIENHTEADNINDNIKECWSTHPNRIILPSTASFYSKVSQVLQVVEDILNSMTIE